MISLTQQWIARHEPQNDRPDILADLYYAQLITAYVTAILLFRTMIFLLQYYSCALFSLLLLLQHNRMTSLCCLKQKVIVAPHRIVEP